MSSAAALTRDGCALMAFATPVVATQALTATSSPHWGNMQRYLMVIEIGDHGSFGRDCVYLGVGSGVRFTLSHPWVRGKSRLSFLSPDGDSLVVKLILRREQRPSAWP